MKYRLLVGSHPKSALNGVAPNRKWLYQRLSSSTLLSLRGKPSFSLTYTIAYLLTQSSSVVADVVFDEGGDEVVIVVIAFLETQS